MLNCGRPLTRDRGAKVCTNNLVGRVDLMDREVIATLHDDVCRPALVEEAIRLAIDELAPARQDRQRRALERDLAEVQQECDRLAEAIGQSGQLSALVRRLRARQDRHTAIVRELGQLGAAPQGAAATVSLAGREGPFTREAGRLAIAVAAERRRYP